MTSTSAERVALILDCLGHPDTDLPGQPRLWRHSDGRYLTEDEAAMIDQEATVGDIRDAMALWEEQLQQMQERNELWTEFRALVRPYSASPDEPVYAAIDRLPAAKMKRAIEIWEQLGPEIEAWRRDQS